MGDLYNQESVLLPRIPDAESRWADRTIVDIYYVEPKDINEMLITSKSLDDRIYAATYVTDIKKDNLDPKKDRIYYELDLSILYYLYQNLFKDYIYLSYDKFLRLVLEQLVNEVGTDLCKEIERNPFHVVTTFEEIFLEHIKNRDFSRFVPDLGLKVEEQTVKGRSIVALTSTNLRLLLNDIAINFNSMVDYYNMHSVSSWYSLIQHLVGDKCAKNMNKIQKQLSEVMREMNAGEIFRELEQIAVFEVELAKYYKHNMGIDWFISYKVDDEEEMNRMEDYYYEIDDYETYYGERPAQVIPAIVMPKSFAKKINVYVIHLVDADEVAEITEENDDYE